MTHVRATTLAFAAAGALAAPRPAAGEPGPRPATVYIDYDGAVLTTGDDSAQDQISCLGGTIEYPGFFGSRALADHVTEQVQAILAPFAVRVVDERPPAYLPYTMVLVGGLPQALGLDAGVGGYACTIDCGDELSRETVLVFAEESRDARELAQTIVHEVAHTWGLDHVAASDLIMSPTTSGAERMLGDGCTALDEPEAAECPEQHAMFCDEPGTQDTLAEVLAIRGPSTPDLEPPRVELVSPRAGDRPVPGQLVRVQATVDDDRPDFGWRIVVPELMWSSAPSPAALELRMPAGEFTVRVEALDQAGNEAVAEVRLVVSDEPAAPGDDGSEPPEPPLDGDPTDLREDDGCRIGAAPSPCGLAGGLLVLIVASVAARRRTPRARRRGSGGSTVEKARD